MKKTKQNFKILSILFLFVFCISCSSSNDDCCITPPINTRTADDVREDFSNINFTSGTNDITLESTLAGFFWNMRIIIPEVASDTNKRPLIISMHGAALTISDDIHKGTACLLEPGFENLDAIIISPNSKGFLWQEEASQVQITAIIDLAKRYLPIDESKIVITGYSDGGNGTWFYAENYSHLFSAAISMASSHNPANGNGVVTPIAIPMYVIHGTEDQLFDYETTVGYVNQSIAAGSDIIFASATDLEHYDSCMYVPYLQDAATWLETVVWD